MTGELGRDVRASVLPGSPPESLTRSVTCEDPHHCVTCSDEGVPMRVASCEAEGGLAWCIDASGERNEVLSALIEHVAVGDVLLVHAGTALARLRSAAEGGGAP